MSTNAVGAHIASAILLAWGAAHLGPTRAVAVSFADISLDNRRNLLTE